MAFSEKLLLVNARCAAVSGGDECMCGESYMWCRCAETALTSDSLTDSSQVAFATAYIVSIDGRKTIPDGLVLKFRTRICAHVCRCFCTNFLLYNWVKLIYALPEILMLPSNAFSLCHVYVRVRYLLSAFESIFALVAVNVMDDHIQSNPENFIFLVQSTFFWMATVPLAMPHLHSKHRQEERADNRGC